MLRKRSGSILFAALFLIGAPAAQAGLYNTAESYDLGLTHRDFQRTLGEIEGIKITEVDTGTVKLPRESPLRKRALLITSLLEASPPGRGGADLTADDYLNGSAYLIRLGKYDSAIRLLENGVAEFPEHFLLYSNLGTAWKLKGEPQRARDYLNVALKRWPEDFDKLTTKQRRYFQSIRWSEDVYRWYRRAEAFHHKLAEREENRNIPQIAGVLFTDDGKFEFVNEDGEYEPGKLAQSQRAKLPPDAMKIVKQLLVWFPDEHGLRWLLGELYNAQGGNQNIRIASEIIDNLVFVRGEGSKTAREHRIALREYVKNLPPEDSEVSQKNDNGTEEAGWNPNPWQMFGVGFLAGAVVLLFASWQVRMLTRRT